MEDLRKIECLVDLIVGGVDKRWTLKGLYDLDRGEILVGEEFWNFVANDEIYDELLDVFQEAGNELREEIDRKFVQFRTRSDQNE
jgi:hypothetical protein